MPTERDEEETARKPAPKPREYVDPNSLAGDNLNRGVRSLIDDEDDESAPKKKPEPTVHTHPALLIRAAKQIGVTEDEIEDSDTETLRAVVQAFGGNRATPAPEKKAEPVVDEEDDLEMSAEDREAIDERIVAHLDRLKKKLKKTPDDKKEIAELKEKLAGMEAKEKARETNQYFKVVDDAFASMPKAVLKRIGDWEASEYDKKDPQHIKQVKVRNAIVAGAEIAPTDSPRVIARKLKASAEALFGESDDEQEERPALRTRQEEPAEAEEIRPGRKKPESEADRWGRSGVPHPTQRQEKPAKGRQSAARTLDRVKKEMAEHGDRNGYLESDEDGDPVL